MFDYFLNRWAFSKQFEPTESGFLYRKSSTSPAILVSEQERRDCLRAFRGRYWRSFFQMLAIAFALVLPLAIASLFFGNDTGAALGTLGGLILAGILLVFVFRQMRSWYSIPLEMFPDRVAARPARTYREANREAVTKRSWPAHIAAGVFLAGLAWFLFPGPRAHPSAPWVYGIILCLVSAGWIWTAWLKMNQE